MKRPGLREDRVRDALPHGMEGLVGLLTISWAELLTLGAAAIPFLVLGSGRPAMAPA